MLTPEEYMDVLKLQHQGFTITEIICSITGVGRTTAEATIAEMGADMSRFPTAGHLCAWAGVAPESHESAVLRRPYGTRHGSTWLQQALIEAARAAARTKGSYFPLGTRASRAGGAPNRLPKGYAESMTFGPACWKMPPL
jgi:transposase